jgi:hypothetical protein
VLDTLQRTIENSPVSEFRQLAILYFTTLGYEEVEITDGPNDGSNDLFLRRHGANPEPLSIQISVQRNGWKSKARTDAVRARQIFKTNNFIYVTSRRLPSVETQPVVDDLWANHQIAGRFVDSQSLASTFYQHNKAVDALEALGVRSAPSAKNASRRPSNLKEDLAYAYAFFGTDASNFREAVVERAVAAYITRSDKPVAKETMIRSVARSLKLKQNQTQLVSAQVDRMLQSGLLSVDGEFLFVVPELAEANKAARIVRGRQLRALEDSIKDRLVQSGLDGASLGDMSDRVRDAAGALMAEAANSASAALEPGRDAGPAKQQIRVQLSRLERDFTTRGFEPKAAHELVLDLTKIISESEIGRTLLAGHLFLSLVAMRQEDLLKALGGHEKLEVFLDASVAIPMLASRLFMPHDVRYFEITDYAARQLESYQAMLSLPEDYLEEAASHLISAYDHYRPLIERGIDLRYSDNAFVAHYSALRSDDRYEGSFDAYIESFGFRPATGAERSFTNERDWVMSRMKTLFSRYGVKIVSSRDAPKQARRAAEEAIAYTAKELNLSRKPRLLDHDISAVADISARASVGDHSVIFCTWDRLHLRLRTAGGSVEWPAMDPGMLGDLLALISDTDEGPVSGAVEVALEMGEEEERKGAEIWDELVSIEKGNLFDAELMKRAESFQADFLERGASRRGRVSDAWDRFRQAEGQTAGV